MHAYIYIYAVTDDDNTFAMIHTDRHVDIIRLIDVSRHLLERIRH